MALAMSTAHRARAWASEETLWADAARKAPDKPRPWLNLGIASELSGHEVAARAAYRRASRLAQSEARLPDERAYGFALAEANLARFDAARGDLPTAVKRLIGARNTQTIPAVERLYAWYSRQLDMR